MVASHVVTFTKTELYFAKIAGRWREDASIGRPQAHGHPDDPSGSLKTHIAGVLGEMAYAKASNIYYHHPLNTFKSEPDFHPNIEVRTRRKPWYELIVRDDDRDDRYFVLVLLEWCANPRARIVGGIPGGLAKRPEWRRTYGGRESAYFVPHIALAPFDYDFVTRLAA